MTRDQHIDQIRAACVAANSNRSEPWEYDTGAPVGSGYIKLNPCRLADVLLAIRGNDKAVAISYHGEFLNCDDDARKVEPLGITWNLRKDDLTEQSDETLAFLAHLLTNH